MIYLIQILARHAYLYNVDNQDSSGMQLPYQGQNSKEVVFYNKQNKK